MVIRMTTSDRQRPLAIVRSTVYNMHMHTQKLRNQRRDQSEPMHHIYNSTAPTYLCDLISFSSTRSLRSTTSGAAAVQRTRTRLGDRAFSIAGPRVWNNPPASLRQTVSAAAFKRQLKTYLLAVRFRVNIRLLNDCIFIVAMRSRPLFLCMLRTTNPSFDFHFDFLSQTQYGCRNLLLTAPRRDRLSLLCLVQSAFVAFDP